MYEIPIIKWLLITKTIISGSTLITNLTLVVDERIHAYWEENNNSSCRVLYTVQLYGNDDSVYKGSTYNTDMVLIHYMNRCTIYRVEVTSTESENNLLTAEYLSGMIS